MQLSSCSKKKAKFKRFAENIGRNRRCISVRESPLSVAFRRMRSPLHCQRAKEIAIAQIIAIKAKFELRVSQQLKVMTEIQE